MTKGRIRKIGQQKTFLLECECGAEYIRIDKWDNDKDIMFIQLYENSFYSRQRGIIPTIIDRLKLMWHIAIGKEYQLFEITLSTEKTIKAFKKFILENL